MIGKIRYRTGKFHSEISITRSASISSFTEKKTKSVTGIKDGFKQLEHDFKFETFRPEKQDYHFRRSVAPDIFSFHWKGSKTLLHLHPNRNFRNLLVNGKRPVFLDYKQPLFFLIRLRRAKRTRQENEHRQKSFVRAAALVS